MIPTMTQIKAMSMMAAPPGDPFSTIAVTDRATSNGAEGQRDGLAAGAVGPLGPDRAPFGPDHALGPAALVPAPRVPVQLGQDAAPHPGRDLAG